jgi:hypothetical protein
MESPNHLVYVLDELKIKIQRWCKRNPTWRRRREVELLVTTYANVCMKLCCSDNSPSDIVDETLSRICDAVLHDVVTDLDNMLISIIHVAFPRYVFPSLGLYQSMNTGMQAYDLSVMGYSIVNKSSNPSHWHEKISRYIHTIARILRSGKAGYADFQFSDYRDLHRQTIEMMTLGRRRDIQQCLHTILLNMLAVYYCQEYLRWHLASNYVDTEPCV